MPEQFKIQEKLEWGHLATFIPNKALPVYNWFYYKEGFSRELVMRLLQMFSPGRRNWVLDPFCGVGTTLLACERLGRRCVTFDVDPIYAEITIRRLEHFRQTGKTGWQMGEVFGQDERQTSRVVAG